jgi:hypothetical protein
MNLSTEDTKTHEKKTVLFFFVFFVDQRIMYLHRQALCLAPFKAEVDGWIHIPSCTFPSDFR